MSGHEPTFQKRSAGISQLIIGGILLLIVIALVAGFILPRMLRGAGFSVSGTASTTQPAAGPNLSPGAEPTPAPESGVLVSSGEVIAGSPGAAGPTAVEASMPGDNQPSADQSAAPADWLRYIDPQYGFAIAYPKAYVIMDPDPARAAAPNLVGQVRFQDKAIAAGQTANLEPPAFAVEVFANPGGGSLAQWLDANEPHRDATRTATTVGGQPGYLVSLGTFIAPGQFYYVASGGYVYRLAPLGQYGEQMLASFTLSGS